MTLQRPPFARRRTNSLPDLVRILPRQQLSYLWLAIFSTFATTGFMLHILTRGRQPATLLALNVIFSGLLAVGYAMVSMPMRRWVTARWLRLTWRTS